MALNLISSIQEIFRNETSLYLRNKFGGINKKSQSYWDIFHKVKKDKNILPSKMQK